jgi:ligand-binding SRPBCC domain-containing protein
MKRTQELGCTQLKAWSFIRKPENLNEITPPDMQFRMCSEVPEEMYEGLIIEYRVKIPFVGTRKWVSEIKHIREGQSFVDEQRVGPYAFWYHYHLIEPMERGVRMTDEIHYDVPFGPLGRLAHAILIKPTLEKIFNYRELRLVELLQETPKSTVDHTNAQAA